MLLCLTSLLLTQRFPEVTLKWTSCSSSAFPCVCLSECFLVSERLFYEPTGTYGILLPPFSKTHVLTLTHAHNTTSALFFTLCLHGVCHISILTPKWAIFEQASTHVISSKFYIPPQCCRVLDSDWSNSSSDRLSDNLINALVLICACFYSKSISRDFATRVFVDMGKLSLTRQAIFGGSL